MIRTPPQHNIVNPPGQVHFEKPLQRLIEDYRVDEAQEAHQKALQEAFERGLRAGYYAGLKDAEKPRYPKEYSSEADR